MMTIEVARTRIGVRTRLNLTMRKSDNDDGSDVGNEDNNAREGDSETDCEVVYTREVYKNQEGGCLTEYYSH